MHLKIIQLFVQSICQACFPQAGTRFQSSALAEQGPVPREMGADPCRGCGVSSYSFPSSSSSPQTRDSAPGAVSSSGLPPFSSAPQPPPCCLFLNADGWAESLPAAPRSGATLALLRSWGPRVGAFPGTEQAGWGDQGLPSSPLAAGDVSQ